MRFEVFCNTVSQAVYVVVHIGAVCHHLCKDLIKDGRDHIFVANGFFLPQPQCRQKHGAVFIGINGVKHTDVMRDGIVKRKVKNNRLFTVGSAVVFGILRNKRNASVFCRKRLLLVKTAILCL